MEQQQMSIEDKLDALMQVVPDNEPFRVDWFMQNVLHFTNTTPQLEKIKGMLLHNYARESGFRYILDERGKKCKSVGGHYKYLQFLKDEDELNKNDKYTERTLKWYEKENAERVFDDYGKIKFKANLAIIISVVLIVLEIIKLIIGK